MQAQNDKPRVHMMTMGGKMQSKWDKVNAGETCVADLPPAQIHIVQMQECPQRFAPMLFNLKGVSPWEDQGYIFAFEYVYIKLPLHITKSILSMNLSKGTPQLCFSPPMDHHPLNLGILQIKVTVFFPFC